MAKPFDNPFDKYTFRYLRALANHNQRAWFKANKSRYETELKAPALTFITAFAPQLAKISPHFLAIAKAQGGSLFRIYRDTRFGKDKTPYKTHLGIQFRHRAGKDVHAPGYYLHLDPCGSFIGVGIWRPDSPSLRRIRDHIVEDSKGWKRASQNKTFRAHFHLAGDSLKRIPRGYDAAHAYADDLRRKEFIAVANITTEEVLAPTFPAQVVKHFKAATPLMKFLCAALDVPF